MGQPTLLAVSVDDTEYSRYEPEKATINATVVATGGAPYLSELVYVELVKARRSRDAVVASSSILLSSSSDPTTATASFHLPDIVDQDLINLVRRGKYFIRARSPATGSSVAIGTSSAAPITINSIDVGTDTNSLFAEIVNPGGTNPLQVTFDGTTVSISLAVSGGVPIPSANTRELVVATILANIGTQFTASFSGAPGLSLSVAEGPTSFSGGRDEISGESSYFDVRIVTVSRLKRDYLFGIPLQAGDAKYVKFQPTNISGISITEVSRSHALGLYNLSYTYSVDGLTNATAQIGSGANGTVTITGVGANEGTAGNSLTVSVVVPVGTSPLSAVLSGNSLTVSLDVTAGVPNPAANTATLVAAAIDALPGFTATASGTGSSSLSVAAGPVSFSGGTDRYIRQLSWDNGPIVSINGAGTFILRRGTSPVTARLLSSLASQEYIVLKCSGTAFLPTASTSDELLVVNRELDDEAIARYLDSAADWLENVELAAYLEPTNVVTDRDPTTIQYAAGINSPNPLYNDPDYDFIKSPLTYFVPRSSEEWVGIQTPYPQLLRVDSLFGSIASTRVIDIDLDWIQPSQQGGLIQLVPFNQTIAFDFLGLIWVNAIRGAAAIPNFWHYNMIVGLRDCPQELQEVLAKKAAMDALIMLGAALRPGVGSVSLGRDGVSQSVSYTTQAQYGPYTGAITAFKEWLESQLPKLKGKYRGPTMIVV